jgi:signal transduction histidine kinase
VTIEFTHDEVPSKLPPDVMLCAFRVVQEALQNALKHSSATIMGVHVSGESDRLCRHHRRQRCRVRRGHGVRKGIGLSSISERVDEIGGALEIQSRPGAGTRLTATVALKEVVLN